jgi:hypothetical protein
MIGGLDIADIGDKTVIFRAVPGIVYVDDGVIRHGGLLLRTLRDLSVIGGHDHHRADREHRHLLYHLLAARLRVILAGFAVFLLILIRGGQVLYLGVMVILLDIAARILLCARVSL